MKRSPCPESIFPEFLVFFSVGKTFPCTRLKWYPRNSIFLCRLKLGFFEVNHKAEFLDSFDEFFCLELRLVSGICS